MSSRRRNTNVPVPSPYGDGPAAFARDLPAQPSDSDADSVHVAVKFPSSRRDVRDAEGGERGSVSDGEAITHELMVTISLDGDGPVERNLAETSRAGSDATDCTALVLFMEEGGCKQILPWFVTGLSIALGRTGCDYGTVFDAKAVTPDVLNDNLKTARRADRRMRMRVGVSFDRDAYTGATREVSRRNLSHTSFDLPWLPHPLRVFWAQRIVRQTPGVDDEVVAVNMPVVLHANRVVGWKPGAAAVPAYFDAFVLDYLAETYHFFSHVVIRHGGPPFSVSSRGLPAAAVLFGGASNPLPRRSSGSPPSSPAPVPAPARGPTASRSRSGSHLRRSRSRARNGGESVGFLGVSGNRRDEYVRSVFADPSHSPRVEHGEDVGTV